MGFKNAKIRAGLPNNSPGDLQAGWRGPGWDGPSRPRGVKAATARAVSRTARRAGLLGPGPSGSPGAHGTQPMAMPASRPQHVGSCGHRQWHRSARWVPVPTATDMLVPVGRREAGWCVFITHLPALAVGSEAVPARRWALGLRADRAAACLGRQPGPVPGRNRPAARSLGCILAPSPGRGAVGWFQRHF